MSRIAIFALSLLALSHSTLPAFAQKTTNKCRANMEGCNQNCFTNVGGLASMACLAFCKRFETQCKQTGTWPSEEERTHNSRKS